MADRQAIHELHVMISGANIIYGFRPIAAEYYAVWYPYMTSYSSVISSIDQRQHKIVFEARYTTRHA